MWTKALKAKINPKSLALQDFGGTVSQLREISTNSAIHRGIRESILYPSFARRPRLANLPSLHSSKPEDVSGNTYARRLKIPKRQRSVLKKIEKIDKSLRREDSRPRRPNHAGRQDAEDIEESTLQVRKRLSEKLAGYKRDSRAAAAIKKHFIFSENYRGKRHWDGGTDPIILNAIVNDPTGTRRYDDGRDNRKTQEGRYRGDSELNVQDLVQQVRSRSKEPEAGRRAQAPPVSSHEGREDSARGSASWKNAYSKDHESGGGYPPASKNFDRDKRSEGRLSKSQRGQGVFAGEESFRGNAYGRSDESQASSGNERNLWRQRAAEAFTPTQRSPRETPTPLSIPYTTPASEFLYGTSVVVAALKARSRTFYKLYIHAGENRVDLGEDENVKRLARTRKVDVVPMGKEGLRLMNKMSQGRPHNGFILEASALPRHPATSLLPIDGPNKPLAITLDHQTKEEIEVNGRDPLIRYRTSFPRYPFLLMIDAILDPGNLGAIIRSAHFLGADGIIYSQRSCAPLTAVALKASAGASETLPLIPVKHPLAFVEASQANGWKFYAAASSQHKAMGKQKTITTSNLDSPIRESPCVIMLGNEGEGLRVTLLKKANFLVTIEGQRDDQGGVDSLNVSVAAALLCEAMLRKQNIVDRPKRVARDPYMIVEEDEPTTTESLGKLF